MFNLYKKNLKKEALNKSEDDILAEQCNLIEAVLSIIKTQIANINDEGNGNPLKEEAEELRRAELLTTKRRGLEFFYQISCFLLKKVKTEAREDLMFYLPNVRTLLDIYAKHLYLANHSLDEQMINCIYERLYFLKKYRPKKTLKRITQLIKYI
jgi:hypothetical protein